MRPKTFFRGGGGGAKTYYSSQKSLKNYYFWPAKKQNRTENENYTIFENQPLSHLLNGCSKITSRRRINNFFQVTVKRIM